MSSFWVDALFLATAALYLGASILFILFLMGRQHASDPGAPENEVRPLAPRLMALAAVLHGVHIVVFSLALHICPVEGIHFPLSVVAMLMGLAYIAMRRRYRIDAVGAFVAPLALATLLASRFVGGGALAPSTRMKSAVLPFHVTMNLLGVALFSLASASAILYLVQERRLKQKRLHGVFQRLPPLDALDRAEHRFLLAGFPLLTLGILSGTLWAVRLDADTVADLVRAGFGYGTWILFAGVLLLRAALGWRGRRAAYGTLAGFGFAMVVLLLYLLRGNTGTVS